MERRINFVTLLCVALLIAAALVIYDKYTRTQRDTFTARQQAIADRSSEEVIGLNERAEKLREQIEAQTLKQQELELKRLELEIKRAEADREQALLRQKELDARETEKKRAAEKADQAEELARMDAESKREQDKRDSAHQKAAAIKSALNERTDAARKLNELAWKKQTAQRAMIIWKNRLDAARNSKARAQLDLGNAQTASRSAGNPGVSRPLPGQLDQGPANAANGSGSMTAPNTTREAVDSAQAQLGGADKAIAEAETSLKKAQDEFEAISKEYDSAQTALQNADRRLSLVAPAPDKSKIYATYALTDGRRVDALCVIESGDDIWVRTSTGMESFKRSEVEEVTKE
jgi:chromosome segregation ATPase